MGLGKSGWKAARQKRTWGLVFFFFFFFTESVTKHSNRLLRVVVESPCLEVFKRHVDVALRDVVWWWTWQC